MRLRQLFGVTTLDIVRANTFVSAAKGTDLAATAVPVIGGHAGITILPLLSQAEPSGLSFSADELEKLTVRIQNAGTEVVEAKAGAGSATLSMAYAAARFAESCLRGLAGEADVIECAFVPSNVEPKLAFFSSKVKLGPKGAAEVYPVGPMTDYEKGWYDKMLAELDGSIKKARWPYDCAASARCSHAHFAVTVTGHRVREQPAGAEGVSARGVFSGAGRGGSRCSPARTVTQAHAWLHDIHSFTEAMLRRGDAASHISRSRQPHTPGAQLDVSSVYRVRIRPPFAASRLAVHGATGDASSRPLARRLESERRVVRHRLSVGRDAERLHRRGWHGHNKTRQRRMYGL